MHTKTFTIKQFNNWIEFRQLVYRHFFTHVRDAQFELVDAMLLSPSVDTFPALSQSPVFRRSWSSVYTAIERGGQDEAWLRTYLSQQVPTDKPCVFAPDRSVWTRPQTHTLEGLRYQQSPTRATEKRSTVKGYALSTLAWVPERGKIWAMPVDTRRIAGRQTAVEVAVEQVNTLCTNRPDAIQDVIICDGAYGNHHF